MDRTRQSGHLLRAIAESCQISRISPQPDNMLGLTSLPRCLQSNFPNPTAQFRKRTTTIPLATQMSIHHDLRTDGTHPIPVTYTKLPPSHITLCYPHLRTSTSLSHRAQHHCRGSLRFIIYSRGRNRGSSTSITHLRYSTKPAVPGGTYSRMICTVGRTICTSGGTEVPPAVPYVHLAFVLYSHHSNFTELDVLFGTASFT
jgi:hypothetical protein